MVSLIVFGCMIAGFLVISLMLLHGKGAWLIAGYNTAPKEEKEKYDEKKLCKSMGICMLLVSIIMAVLGVLCGFVEFGKLAENSLLMPAVTATILIVVIVVTEIIYANKNCKIKKDA